MKLKILVIFLFLFFFWVKPTFAQVPYTIEKFDSDIQILNSGVVEVVETLDVNFSEMRHGIYRDIPIVYENSAGNKIYTKVNIEKVTQDDSSIKSEISSDSNYLRLKIGDPDKTISGSHVYKIFYGIEGVLASYKNFDEFYWNTTGNNWDAPISSATATVKIPSDSIVEAACYQGALNSTEKCVANILSPRLVTFSSTHPFAPEEGMTIAAGFKKGTFPIIIVPRPKSFLEKFFSPLSLILFLILLVAGIEVVLAKWFQNGRDSWIPGIAGITGKNIGEQIKPFGAHEPIVVEYTPPENLPPALIGLLVDEKADTLDVTSTIIDLASRGFLTITEIPKKWLFGTTDYLLKKTTMDTKNLLSYEKELLTRLFIQHQKSGAGFTSDEINTSELRTKFYDDLAKVKEKLYEEAINRKYFPTNPEKIRVRYAGIGIILLIIGILMTIASSATDLIIFADVGIAALIIGVFVLIFSRFMPRRTAQGRELYRRIKGYRMFIDRAESYKQKFFENKNTFTDVLPYAIVFGLTGKFAKALKDMGYQPNNPSWYTGVNTFNIVNFSSNVDSFSSSMSHAIASTPSSSGSSGGGFSGGGFGGGGGGSW